MGCHFFIQYLPYPETEPMSPVLAGGFFTAESPGKPVTLPLVWFSSVQFSRSVVSSSLRPHESQHAWPPCPSPTPGVYSNPCPSSRWCHPAISSSVVPFSSCPQSLPASGSFPMSQLFASGGQSTGVSASASVLPMNTQNRSPLGWTGWILVVKIRWERSSDCLMNVWSVFQIVQPIFFRDLILSRHCYFISSSFILIMLLFNFPSPDLSVIFKFFFFSIPGEQILLVPTQCTFQIPSLHFYSIWSFHL